MKLIKNVLLIITLLVTHFSFGKEIIVTSINDGAPTDVGTFRWAVNIAQPNDTIIINVKGTIALGSSIAFTTDNLTVIGPYPKHNTFTVSGNNNLFEISGRNNINFKGLGFKNSTGTYSIIDIQNSSNINFKDCLFENNTNINQAGGCFYINSSSFIILNTMFFDNSATSDGGVIYITGSNPNTSKIINCTFSNNTNPSNTAGAIYFGGTATIDLVNNLFINNSANYAQAIYKTNGSIINMFNNVFLQNGVGDQVVGISYNTGGGTNSNLIGLNSMETNNPPIQFASSTYTPTNLFLTSNLIEDGYGLKYFRINDNTSALINNGVNVTGVTISKDCRRAPRFIDGTIDIGPVEYTPLIVTNTSGTGAGSLVNAVQGGGFIEFDIPNFNPATDVIILTAAINIASPNAYIDGFSQPGSAIAGPGTDGVNGVTPADSLIHITTGTINTGFNVNAPNVTIAGLEIYGFNGYGVANLYDNFNLYGCHIGVYKNGGSFSIDGCNISGVLVNNGSNMQIGGKEHWQRNVISANGNLGGTTSNIRIGSATISVKIIGNFIGLHPTGNSAFSPSPNTNAEGIWFDGNATSTSNITIGESSFLGRNIISGNTAHGIFADGNATLNIDNNYIGVGYDGVTSIGNGSSANLPGVKINGNILQVNIGNANGNVISGNNGEGIHILNYGNFTNNLSILNNIIGLGADTNTIVPNAYNGINIDSSKDVTVGASTKGNFISGNSNNGILTNNSDNISIVYNVIGTTPDGLIAKPNAENGIMVGDNNITNIINNLISGNTKNGILANNSGTDLNISGNFIGTDLTGQSATPNQENGIKILDSHQAIIVGVFPNDNNVISANGLNGIYTESPNVIIDGNNIGLTKDQTAALGNQQNGIQINASNVVVGGNNGNVISANNSHGIYCDTGADNISIDNCIIGTNNSTQTTNFGNNSYGIYCESSSNHNIGVNFPNVIVGSQAGIFLNNSSNDTIQYNFIGITQNGDIIPNTNGIELQGNSSSNIIGGLFASQFNVISGNQTGVLLNGSNVQSNNIEGNYIGVLNDVLTTAKPNDIGIEIKNGATANTIGKQGSVNYKNIISSNTQYGIYLNGVVGNKIARNLIGSDATSTSSSPNNIGVFINGCSNTNSIGLTGIITDGPIISGNITGILINNSSNQLIRNCRIGTRVGGTQALPNTHGIIIQNSSSSNIIGGGANNEGNLISGNDSIGVYIKSGCGSNEVKGNLFGTTINIDAVNGLDNLIGVGIENNTSSNTIGGDRTQGEGNTFSNTNDKSIYINNSSNQHIEGNRFGLKIDNTPLGGSNTTVGIYLKNADDNSIGSSVADRENTISNLSIGVMLDSSDDNTVLNNLIGTDSTGQNDVAGGIDGIGIRIDSTAKDNTIGPGNIISGNNVGVRILNSGTLDNLVVGNYIGVNNSGNTALSNNQGVVIANGASNNIIGGLYSTEKNVISGNQEGISIADAGTSNNIVSGNLIGLGINETTPIANGGGIAIFDDADNNHIGGADADSVNYICSNTFGGILINTGANNNKIKGNKIGIKPNNSAAGNLLSGIVINNSSNNNTIGGIAILDKNEIAYNSAGIEINNSSNNNVILGNSIHDNGGLAIDINNDGVTVNNSSTTQNGVEIPTILQAFDCNGGPSEVQIGVELRNLINGSNYILEIYKNQTTDPSGYGEATVLVKRFNFTASLNGTDTLNFNLSTIPSGSLSASLTALSSNGGTSEMSANFGVTNTPTAPTYTVTDETCNGSGDGSISVQTSAMNYTDIDGTSIFNNATTVSATKPAGTYNVIVTYLNSCQETSTQILDVGPTPGFTYVTTNDTCGLGVGSIVLNDTTTTISGTTQYTIDNGTNFLPNNNFTALSGGSYNTFMTITIAGYVCSSDTQTVTINDIDLSTNGVMDFTYDDFCAAGTGVVTSSPSFTNGTYSVSPPVGNINTTTGDITGVTVGTTYTITYSYGNTCSVDQTFIPLNPVDASFSYDNVFNTTDSLCYGEELAPNTNNSGGTFSITGFGNPTIDTTGIITNAVEGQTYNVEYVTANTGCPDTSNVAVFILPLPVQPIISTADTLLCLDDTVQVLTSNIATDWYINSPTSAALNVSPLISYQPQNSDVSNGTTTFYAYYFDANGCASPYDSINITRVDNSSISLNDSVDICLGSEVELSAENAGVVAYLWSNNSGVDDSTDPTIIVSPNQKTYYFVTLTTAEGCIINDSILVTIKDPSECNIETYTAFSPNGDNVNDTWFIDGIEGFKENSVYIYNHWGDLIQKIENYDNASNVWDGKTKFGVAPTGTYFYIVEANGTKALTGWVQIVK